MGGSFSGCSGGCQRSSGGGEVFAMCSTPLKKRIKNIKIFVRFLGESRTFYPSANIDKKISINLSCF